MKDRKTRGRPLPLLLAVILLAAGPLRVSAQGAGSREYDIKAAFLYNFVKYVDLSPRHASGPTVTVAILGSDPSNGSFDLINHKVVQGKTLVVRHLGTRLDFQGVDILFITASEKARLKQILEALNGSGILAVGETPGFAQSGGAINFITENNKVRFEINPDAAGRADVKISSQLLRLARIVHG